MEIKTQRSNNRMKAAAAEVFLNREGKVLLIWKEIKSDLLNLILQMLIGNARSGLEGMKRQSESYWFSLTA